MKVYSGEVRDGVPVIEVIEMGAGEGRKVVASGPAYGWGVKTNHSAMTAQAILTDYLGAQKAEALYRRFSWRRIVGLSQGQKWSMDSASIDAEIGQITAVDTERVKIAPLPTPVVVDADKSLGPGGTAIEWDRSGINPNPPPKPKE